VKLRFIVATNGQWPSPLIEDGLQRPRHSPAC
jgi:hypothetical protein